MGLFEYLRRLQARAVQVVRAGIIPEKRVAWGQTFEDTQSNKPARRNSTKPRLATLSRDILKMTMLYTLLCGCFRYLASETDLRCGHPQVDYTSQMQAPHDQGPPTRYRITKRQAIEGKSLPTSSRVISRPPPRIGLNALDERLGCWVRVGCIPPGNHSNAHDYCNLRTLACQGLFPASIGTYSMYRM